MSPAHTPLEGLVQPGGCEQHPTAGRIGTYCLSCVIIPAPSGVEVDVNAVLTQESRDGGQERLTVDTITSDQLDALYDRIATLEHVAAGNKRHVQLIAPELERAEAFRNTVADLIADHEGDEWADHSATRALRVAITRAAVPSGPAATDATELEKTARVFAALHQSAEQHVSRVIALYERWVKAGPPPLGTSVSRWWDARLVELRAALAEPAPAASTPLVDRPFRSHRPAPDSPATLAGQPLTEEQAAAVRAADLPPGMRITRAAVDEALRQAKEPDLVHPEPRAISEPPEADEPPLCACTYGERCPNCRD